MSEAQALSPELLASFGSSIEQRVIDELNAVLGLLRAERLEQDLDEPLELVQHELFAYGGELSMPEFQQLNDEHVQRLEAG